MVACRTSTVAAALLVGLTNAIDLKQLYVQTQTNATVEYSGDVSKTVQGACGLGPLGPAGLPKAIPNIHAVAGVSAEYYKSNACGMCIQGFDQQSNMRVLYVNDRCQSCQGDGLNIAESGPGKQIWNWYAIPCPTSGPISYVFENPNSYWFKVQPRYFKCPVSNMSITDNAGKNVTGSPTADHFFAFQANNNGPPFQFPITVVLTSIFEETITDQLLSASNDTEQTGKLNAQFASCAPAFNSPNSNTTVTSATTVPVNNGTVNPANATAASPLTSISTSDDATMDQVTTTHVFSNSTHQTTQTCTTTVRPLTSVGKNLRGGD